MLPSTAVDLVEVVDAELVEVAGAEVDRRGSGEVEQALAAYVRAAVDETIPDGTRRALREDGQAFTDWCAAAVLSAWPASADTLAAYVKHLTTAPRPTREGRKADPRPLGPSSIARRISSVRTLHRAARLVPPDALDARRILDGYRHRLAVDKSEQAKTRKAAPALPGQLRAMLATLDRSTFAGARDAALLLLGFTTAARVSELVAVDRADLARADHGWDVKVYRRKVKKWTDNAVLYGSDPVTCPVRAIEAYLALLADQGRTEGALFLRIDRHGRIAEPLYRHGRPIGDPSGRITAEAAANVIARCADVAGLDGQWTGHSLRRGFATAARLAGHDPISIGEVGGWAKGSPALAGYMDDVDRVTSSPLVGIGL